MKVGDLVKVYNFSRRARERFRESFGENTDDHTLGLIASGDTTMDRNWHVWLCKHNITEIYQEDRLEVVNASR